MKKTLSLFLSVVIIATSFCFAPFEVYASGSGTIEEDNQFYTQEYVAPRLNASTNLLLDYADEIREAMSIRQSDVTMTFKSTSRISNSTIGDWLSDTVSYATSDSVSTNCIDGDYIRWQYGGYGASYTYTGSALNGYNYTISLSIDYYDTQSEEQELNEVVEDFVTSVDFSTKSDYEVLKDVHDFILDSCDYNYSDMDNDYNFSAYGALVKGKAVCQGYALAFYRLCKELGYDVRFVSSDSNTGCHAWNIVKLDGVYYYVDCTWDDEMSDQYTLFLVDGDTIVSLDDKESDGTTYYDEHVLDDDLYGDTYFANNYSNYFASSDYDSELNVISNCTVSYSSLSTSGVTVKSSAGNTLTYNTDYTLAFNGSDYLVKVTGKGDYSGSCVRVGNIENYSPLLSGTDFSYTSSDIEPSINFSGTTLTNGTDYEVIYVDNNSVGTAKAYVLGIGKYSGCKVLSFNINYLNLSDQTITLEYTSVTYDGAAKEPAVTIGSLVLGEDYEVKYTNNREPGTATVQIKGKGNVTGSVTKTFKINKINISSLNISLSETSYIYDGNYKKPSVTVDALKNGYDYSLAYSSNKKPGIAKVTITGIGDYYTGSVTKTFTIKPKATSSLKASSKTTSVTLNWKKVSYASGYQIQRYKNKEWTTIKTISDASTLKATIKNLSAGKSYSFRVRAFVSSNGKKVYGSYTSVKVGTKPKKVSISSLKSSKKSITVKWKKVTCSGYQIQYSTKSNFKKSTKVTVSGSSKKSKTIKSLKSGKKYYVRVRAYKTVNGKKYYGSYSKTKSVKCK